MSSRNYDLYLVGVAAIAALALSLFGIRSTGVQAVVALGLVCLLPGYAITAALFPTRSLGRAERLGVSLGLSLTVTTLSALLLDWTPWGLRADVWAVSLGGLALLACPVALLRRRASRGAIPGRRRMPLSASQALLFGLAALLACGAVVLARAGAIEQKTPPFSQLWMLPDESSGPAGVRIGIRSMEVWSEQYRLQVRVGDRIVFERPVIALDPGEMWEETIALPVGQSEAAAVEAQIYLRNAPDEVYRRVWLWTDSGRE